MSQKLSHRIHVSQNVASSAVSRSSRDAKDTAYFANVSPSAVSRSHETFDANNTESKQESRTESKQESRDIRRQ